jgi:hypothetical protein
MGLSMLAYWGKPILMEGKHHQGFKPIEFEGFKNEA